MYEARALAGPARAIDANFAFVAEALGQTPTVERFKTLSLSISNLSHLLAYLEGNAGFMDSAALTVRVRTALQGDAFQLRCADWLEALPPSAMEKKLATWWQGWIVQQRDPLAQADRAKIEGALCDLDNAVQACDADLLALLHRLGAKTSNYAARMAFAALTSALPNPDLRLRLSRACLLNKIEAAAGIETCIDAVVTARFEAGVTIAPTLAGGSLNVEALATFVEASLKSAGAMSQTLLNQVAPGGEGEAALACEFPRYMSQHFSAVVHLKLPLEPALDMLAEIGERALGLCFQRAPGSVSPIFVNDGSRSLGAIELDGLGARLPVSSKAVNSGATARILCRLNGSQPPTLSFDAMRMVFHEFGHALAHLLSHARKPSLSGLDEAPIERLELLSTWFEHWIYHCDLAKYLSLDDGSRSMLASACAAKILEAYRSMAGRAVCARLDLDLHRMPNLGAHRAWSSAVAALSGPAPAASDVWADFTHPLMRHHPGSAFVFPLAQGFAAEHLASLIDQPISYLSSDQRGLGAAIRPDVALRLPKLGAVESFFDAVLARLPDEGGKA